MGRPALSEADVAAVRARILAEAFALFKSGGFDAVSMREVARRAELAPSGIYHFYKNRQALIEAIWFEPVAATVREMMAIARSVSDPARRIEAVLTRYFEFARLQPEIYREAFLFVRPRSEAPPPGDSLENLPFFDILCGAIGEGQRSGQFKAGDAAVLAQVLWAGVHGVLALSVNIEGWDYADQDTRNGAMLEVMLRGLALCGD